LSFSWTEWMLAKNDRPGVAVSFIPPLISLCHTIIITIIDAFLTPSLSLAPFQTSKVGCWLDTFALWKNKKGRGKEHKVCRKLQSILFGCCSLQRTTVQTSTDGLSFPALSCYFLPNLGKDTALQLSPDRLIWQYTLNASIPSRTLRSDAIKLQLSTFELVENEI